MLSRISGKAISWIRVESELEKGMYPLLLTPLDTAGEKDFEEFVGDGETVKAVGMPNLVSIGYRQCDEKILKIFFKLIQGWIDTPERYVDKQRIVEAISSVVPELTHLASEKKLDDRM